MDRILHEQRQQIEFIEDQERWRSPALKRLRRITPPPARQAEHEALLAYAAPPRSSQDAVQGIALRPDIPGLLDRLRRGDDADHMYADAVETVVVAMREHRRERGAAVVDEYEKLVRRLRDLRAPEALAAEHAALTHAFVAVIDASRAYYERVDDESSTEAIIAARRSAEEATEAAFEATKVLYAAAGVTEEAG